MLTFFTTFWSWSIVTWRKAMELTKMVLLQVQNDRICARISINLWLFLMKYICCLILNLEDASYLDMKIFIFLWKTSGHFNSLIVNIIQTGLIFLHIDGILDYLCAYYGCVNSGFYTYWEESCCKFVMCLVIHLAFREIGENGNRHSSWFK